MVQQHPGIEILVNNLGIFEPKSFEDIPDEDWMRFFDVNVLSGVRLARLCLPAMAVVMATVMAVAKAVVMAAVPALRPAMTMTRSPFWASRAAAPLTPIVPDPAGAGMA